MTVASMSRARYYSTSDAPRLVRMLLSAGRMQLAAPVVRLSLRSHLLLLLLASLPLGAVATLMLLGRDPRRGWYIAAGVLILIAVGLALLVSRRVRRIVRAIENGAHTLAQGEVPTLGPFPVQELDDLAQALVAAGGTRRELEAKLRASESKLAAMLSGAPTAIMCVDAAHRVIRFNRAAEVLFGCTAGDAVGGAADRFFSQRFLRVLDTHLEGARGRLRAITAGVEAAGPIGFRRDGTEFALDAAIARIDAPGGPVCLIVVRDVTEQKRTEDERAEELRRAQVERRQAEQAARQSVLLAEASGMLTGSLDYETTLASLARLLAGTLADWCMIDLVEDGGEIRRLVVAHSDATRELVARELQGHPLRAAELPETLARVLTGAHAELIAEADEAAIARMAVGERQTRLVTTLGIRSAMIVPLVGRGHVLGALTLVRAEGGPYTPADLGMTQGLAGRVTTAVDQGRKYRSAQQGRTRFVGLVEGLDGIVWEADPATLEITFVSHRAEDLLGYPVRRWLDEPAFWLTLIHPDDREAVLSVLRDRARSGRDVRLEYRMATADGRLIWIDNIVRPVTGDDGRVRHVQGLMLDITQRKRVTEERDHLLEMAQAARVEAEASAERARFLAGASDLLASSLDQTATLDSLVRLAVPGFADWCVVHLAEPIAGRRLHTAGTDPEGTGVAQMLERLATSVELQAFLPALDQVKEGQPLLLPEIGPAWLEGLQIMQQLSPKSAMVVPMTARGRAIGTISFIVTRPERRYGPADLAMARDLAQRAAIAVDNARLYAEAEGANRAKDQFLATLSHELRTPLTAMLGWVLMLRSGRLSGEEAASALASIERNTRVQAQLINDLLDVSRIVAGKLQIDKRPVDLRVVIEHALESVRRDTETRKLVVSVAIDPDAAWVPGDAVRLEQIALNLLGNAAKFTPEGGRIEVHLDRVDNAARLTVTDTGQGIDAAMLPHIFESFHQADSSSTRRHGGLGLGLAIVRRLVVLHGGRVEAASAGQDQGAAFTVYLPLLAREARPVAAGTPGESRRPREDAALPRLDRVRALVVDDHEDSRRLVKTVLADCGAEVREADSADAALDILAGTYIDVLISDIGMPGADGYDLIGRVREREREHGGRIPAVALTAYAGEENRDRALAAGFTAHVTKPVSPAALVRIVAEVVGRPALL
jgi:PAS domain S-box-containing protein